MQQQMLKDIRYGIGLDIGITSVGWAALALNEVDEPIGVIDMGVRIFDAAEHPKDGASLALPRRMARSTRRRIRRRAHRKERIRKLLVEQGLLTAKELDALYDKPNLEDIYELRVRGLDMPLRADEFARVLIHLSQRRGFKSNRKADSSAQEAGKLLKAVDQNRQRMEEGEYRTVGEMFAKDPFYAEQKRNKDGQYLSTVHRDMVTAEVRMLFARQRGFAQAFAGQSLEDKYLDILLSQRSFDEGPGGDSPYGGNQVQKMRGTCAFEKQELRAPKAAYTFEEFRFWEKVNHLRILSLADSRSLSMDEKELLLQQALTKDGLRYHHLRDLLHLGEEERFNDINYMPAKGKRLPADDPDRAAFVKECEKKPFAHFQKWHVLRKALDKVSKGRIKELTPAVLDDVAEVLSLYKQDDAVREQLMMLGLAAGDVEALMTVPSFAGFAHLSVIACRKLLPFLKQGMNYDAACTAAGYDFRGHERKPQIYLPSQTDDMEEITSPVVRRAVAQTIKVTNAIIRMMEHSPVYVNIELAREMAKDFSERYSLMKDMEENAQRNERIMQRLRDEFHVPNPTGLDLVKLKLYEEQLGKCAYSLQALDIHRLFEKGYAEIDHIIPYSICFDDRYSNKVLVSAKANRDKGNRLPLQYLSGEEQARFIAYTQNAPYRGAKRRNLLKPRVTEEDKRQFKERNLQDTKHMSRFLYNYITDYLVFSPFATSRKKHVTAVNGGITAHLRKRWGLSKIRADGDKHHAQDAVVVACATDGMIAEISRFYQKQEGQYEISPDGTHSMHSATGQIFPFPWPSFDNDLKLRLEARNPAQRLADLHLSGRLPSYDLLPVPLLPQARPIFVSRMPQRKVSGPAHKDTVKGRAAGEEGLVVKRVALKELSFKDGQIVNYYRPGDDPALYHALCDRLAAHGGDAKKAFADPICKPGTQAPVRKVKVIETATLPVPVHGGKGLADNGSMVRLDIFFVEGDGYYLVPIYVADTVKPELPSLACVAYKPYVEWKPMSEEDFLFSLYPNDLILLTDKTPILLKRNKKQHADTQSQLPLERAAADGEPLYYRGCDISTASINGCSHDNAYLFNKGLKRLKSIEKYQVDMLGRVHRVNRERRMPFQ